MASTPLPILDVTTAAIAEVQTATTGTNWTALTGAEARTVVIVNNTGTDIEVRRGGAGVALKITDGSVYPFSGLKNANQLSLRRADTSNTQVTVQYEVQT